MFIIQITTIPQYGVPIVTYVGDLANGGFPFTLYSEAKEEIRIQRNIEEQTGITGFKYSYNIVELTYANRVNR